jgi:hypothetical protein
LKTLTAVGGVMVEPADFNNHQYPPTGLEAAVGVKAIP